MIAAISQAGSAREPAEVRGHGRDDVRLLVAHRGSGTCCTRASASCPSCSSQAICS